MILMRFSNDLLTMSFWRSRRRRLRDFSCIPWLPPPFERRTRPDPVTRNRLAAARLVFILGTVGSSWFRALREAARRRTLMSLGEAGRVFWDGSGFLSSKGSSRLGAGTVLPRGTACRASLQNYCPFEPHLVLTASPQH